MKVGIVTIIGQANYGNKLQHYAVVQVLKKLGIEVVTFDYLPKKSIKLKIKELIKDTLRIRDYYCRKRINLFSDFDKDYIKYDCIQNCDSYDFVVCGSDQIWNCSFKWLMPYIDICFGTFMPKEKRIAYSASIGANEISEDYITAFRKNIDDMKSISVREYDAKVLIKNLTGRDVDVTIDPTLMLSKDEWLSLAKKPQYINDERFILTYFLGEYDISYKEYIYSVSKKYNLSVINLEADYKNVNEIDNVDVFMTSPEQFIWLFSNCEIVFTDSYHGSIFSIIMGKPFRCFGRIQSGLVDMNSRMKSLFNMFSINDWCQGDINENIDNIFYKDYSKVETVLNNERRFAFDYLKKAME